MTAFENSVAALEHYMDVVSLLENAHSVGVTIWYRGNITYLLMARSELRKRCKNFRENVLKPLRNSTIRTYRMTLKSVIERQISTSVLGMIMLLLQTSRRFLR